MAAGDGHNNRTLLVAHIHSLHFGTSKKYPGVEGGERRLDGAHQRRRGRGAKPGRGGSDAESRRSSPGILLSLRAERALSRGAGTKPAKLSAPLPVVDFRIKARVEANRKIVVFKRLQVLGNAPQSSQCRVYFHCNPEPPEMFI